MIRIQRKHVVQNELYKKDYIKTGELTSIGQEIGVSIIREIPPNETESEIQTELLIDLLVSKAGDYHVFKHKLIDLFMRTAPMATKELQELHDLIDKYERR